MYVPRQVGVSHRSERVIALATEYMAGRMEYVYYT